MFHNMIDSHPDLVRAAAVAAVMLGHPPDDKPQTRVAVRRKGEAPQRVAVRRVPRYGMAARWSQIPEVER